MTDNEVILDRLFRPTKKITVAGRELVVRALSGPEQEARAFYATGQARKLQKQLADPESEAYQYRLQFLDDKSAEELALFLKSFRETEIRRQAIKENDTVYQPIPDEATDEERRATLDAREKALAERDQKIDEIVKTRLGEYVENNLAGKSKEELMKIAKAQIAEPYLNERANMSFVHYSLYVSVQSRDGVRYFSSPEDAGALEQNIVFHIFDSIKEVNDIDPLALKSNGVSSTE